MPQSQGWQQRAREAARVRAYRATLTPAAKRERESGEDDAQCAVEALQSLHFSGARASDAPRALLRPTHSSPIPNSPHSHARAPPSKQRLQESQVQPLLQHSTLPLRLRTRMLQ